VTTDDDSGAHALSLSPEDIAASEAPLSYAAATRQVGSVDGGWRAHTKLLAPLADRHQLLTACRFLSAVPSLSTDWSGVDLGLLPYTAAGSGDLAARTAAGRRLLRFWCDAPEQARGAGPLRDMLNRGLLYAIYPNLQLDAPQHRDLYLRLVPVIERLSAAGWEPVTLARGAQPDLQIERYGRLADGNLCFALRNVAAQPLAATVRLDPALGLPAKPAALQVMNLLTDTPVTPTAEHAALAVPVKLLAGEATALLVLPTARYRQRVLLDAAEALAQATAPAGEEITYQTSRPGQLLIGDTPPGARAATILCDGWKTDQGLIFAAHEPLTLSLDLNSPHRLQWVRVHYGLGEGYAAPEATVEGIDRAGTWHRLGALAATTDTAWPAALVDVQDAGEYQRLRLVYPELQQRLWLKEIELEGRDGALTRAAERFRTLAAGQGCGDFGVVSQLAMVLRVRRMLGHDRTLQERALTSLADFCSVTSGISARVELPPEAPRSGPAKAQLVASNRGEHRLQEGSVKLKLPPGWSAAPGKFEVNLRAGETVRLPVTLNRSSEGGRLTLLITGVLDGTPLFMSREE